MPIAFNPATDIHTNPDGSFRISVPALNSWVPPRTHGEHKFRMVIANNAIPAVEHTEVITIKYTNTPTKNPTTSRITLPNHTAHVG